MESVRIEKLVPGGQGLATLASGKKAFLWNALPGELVNFEATKSKSSYCEGIATQILEASPDRIVPRDDCYLATSPWQIFNYAAELRAKQQLVAECLHQHQLSPVVLPTITDHREYFYRNKMEYSLYWDNQQAKIFPAFHQRGTHRKIPIQQSSLERPEIWQRATTIIDQLNRVHAEARRYQSLLLRCSQTGQVSGNLFENGKAHPQMLNLTDNLLGQNYSYSPNGFFQINLPVYELALKAIATHIHADNVLDLYAGVGSIGLSVARQAQKLTLVEVNGAAFAEMQTNAKNSNATCVLAKSEDVTDYIQSNQCVILDPPRAGCDPKLLDALNTQKPRQIIYLSCNPATQARDLAILTPHYNIDLVQPFNFFPHTPHVETVVLMSRVDK